MVEQMHGGGGLVREGDLAQRQHLLMRLKPRPRRRRRLPQHIKTHYYTSHPTLNHWAIIPKGCPDAWWETLDHGRATKFA